VSGNRLYGPLHDVSGDAGYAQHPERVGFFTDTSVCIGCKACEVACKEWNGLPDPDAGALTLTGMSYDNTGALGASSWRHVAFIEQAVPAPPAEPGLISEEDGPDGATRWLMASDVCKHCTHAACLDVCPTGALVRTEFGTVIVQPDVCNGCAYCATACPTDSIQFGPLDELRAIAQTRLDEVQRSGAPQARLYGEDPEDGVGGAGAFFLLLDEPEVYGLPPDPVVTTRDLPQMWRWAGAAAGMLAAGALAACLRGGRGRP